MPRPVIFKYACETCGKVYKHKDRDSAEKMARDCEQNHDVVYVRLLRSDVQRLLAFLVSKEDGLITPTMVRSLRAYRKLK